MPRGENILVSEHSIPKYNGVYSIQTYEINGKPWYKNNSGCMLYFYNANSGGGPSWSLDDRTQDGTNDWFRGGWIEPPNSGGPPLGTRSWAILETHRRFEIKLEYVSIPDESGEPILDSDSGMLRGEISVKGVHGKYLSATPEGRVLWNSDVAHVGEYFRVEQRENGKIALRSAFDMYLSAQPDGRMECNRREAPPGGWEEFTVEYRSNDLVCLKSCHGKYLSAQKDGPWDWTMHQDADAQNIQIEPYRKTGEPVLSERILNSDQNYVFAPEHKGWHWHNDRARAMGGHIASVTSAKEDEDITRISGGAPVWLGGIRKGDRYRGKPIADRKPGDPGDVGPGPEDWYWSDGRPWSYTNWGPGEPNNWDGGENRVQHLGKLGAVWNDVGEDWDGPAVYRIPAESTPPPGGWEDIQLIYSGASGDQASDAASRIQRHLNKSRTSTPASDEPIQVLEAVPGKPVRFKLNHPPSHNDAWVGIYPTGASDQDHGAPPRWKYIRDVDVNNVSLSNGELTAGDWSIRVFSDGGYTLVQRKDVTIHTAHKIHSSKAASSARESIEILEAVANKPVRFKINNPPTNHDAWVGIYPPNASDQDHGAENYRWKWLRNIDVNNVSFPKRAAGPWSIRVFSNGGHALHERKDFDVKPPEPVDPAVLESSRRSALIALFIGMVLLAPSIPLFIAGLGEGLSDGMTSATLEIKDSDGQGDLGWGIYVEGSAVDFNSNGIYDHCENIIVNATHSGSWMSDPWSGYQSVNGPDETRQVFYLETAHEGSGCSTMDGAWPESRYHDGRDLIKIGRACYGCMAGTTTITAQNSDGGEVMMWIQNEEKKEVLGMLIPGAIFMGIGGFTFIVSLFALLNMGFKSMPSSSSKRRAVAATGVGITLVIMGLPLLIIGSISTGEGRLAMLIPGVVMFSIGVLVIVLTATIGMRSTEGHPSGAKTGASSNANPNLEVLSFNHRQPVRFSITNPPGHNDAWVGLYPANADDRNHGDRWHYLRDIDVSNATLPGQEQGRWSLRLFSDGGYSLQQRVDFELRADSKEEVWMKEAEFDGQRLNGLVPDHRNEFTKKITSSKIKHQHKVGDINRFETHDTTYLVYDRDLQEETGEASPFWETN